jgi:transcription initiation factor TFIIB
MDLDAGEEVCGECGLVISNEIVDRGPEWRAFTFAEKNSRSRTGIGSSPTLYGNGLSTVFRGDRDASGHHLNIEVLSRMDRLRRYDNRSKFDETWRKNLSFAMAELDRMCVVLAIPKNIKEQSAHIYREALKADLIRGRSIDAFVAASIYAACRQAEIPRPIKKISEVSTRDHGEITRSYRILLQKLKYKMPLDTPIKFIPNIASKLNLGREAEQKAMELLKKAQARRGISGKEPHGLAAAALYMACLSLDYRKTQKEVADAAGTTEVTLRNRMRGLESVLRVEPKLDALPMPIVMVGH